MALLVDDVPIDVLAERLGTTRGALYKTLHEARKRLRVFLAGQGYLALHVAEGGDRSPGTSGSPRTRSTG